MSIRLYIFYVPGCISNSFLLFYDLIVMCTGLELVLAMASVSVLLVYLFMYLLMTDGSLDYSDPASIWSISLLSTWERGFTKTDHGTSHDHCTFRILSEKKLYNIVWGFANSKNPKESTRTMTYIPAMNHSFRPYAMLPIMPAIGLSFLVFFLSRPVFCSPLWFSFLSRREI